MRRGYLPFSALVLHSEVDSLWLRAFWTLFRNCLVVLARQIAADEKKRKEDAEKAAAAAAAKKQRNEAEKAKQIAAEAKKQKVAHVSLAGQERYVCGSRYLHSPQ